MSTLSFVKLYADSAYWQVKDSGPGGGLIGSVRVYANISDGGNVRASFEAQPFIQISRNRMITILEFMEQKEKECDTNN